jgi:endonuclease/exonuclease/phosphatase (EEP) superfamily protein YafD
MRNAHSPKESRSTRIKHYLIATVFAYRIYLFLFLIAPTSIMAGPVDPRPECDIGRSPIDAQPGHTFATGMVGEPGRIQHIQAAMAALDPSRISVLSWNIKKGSESAWDSDLRRLAAGKDLVLLQEAQLIPSFYGALDGSMYRNSAKGWKTSGVLTAARVEHVNRCSYQHQEPILGTPKASLLTEYRLIGTDDTLLVVNVHVVNFTIGLSEFREQIGDLHTIMARHNGPIIFSGDFNTWRSSRLKILRLFNSDLGLRPIRFADDNRTRKFGYALDHIFVRGLRSISSHVESVESSDHNPLITVLGAFDSIAAN